MNAEIKRLRAELSRVEKARKCGWKHYFAVTESYRKFVSETIGNGYLNEAQKRTFKEMFLSQEECYKTCTICLDMMSDDMAFSKCAHIYHKQCLQGWTELNNTCPVCRESITTLIDL